MQRGLPGVSRIKFPLQSYAPPGEALGACHSGKRRGLEAAELGHAGAKRTAPGCGAEGCRKQLLLVTAGQHHDPSPLGQPGARHSQLPEQAELTQPCPVPKAPVRDARPCLSRQDPAPARDSRRWRRAALAPLPPHPMTTRSVEQHRTERRVSIPVFRNNGCAVQWYRCWDAGLRGGR